MIKAAFTTWHDRIAPLFDTSRQAYIVEVLTGRTLVDRYESFQGRTPVQRVLCLVEWEVSTLVCGAISRPVKAIAAAHGIKVISFVTGGLHEAVQAWLDGCLVDKTHGMTGFDHSQAHGGVTVALPPQPTFTLPLDLSKHCIETEIKRCHNRAVSGFFRYGPNHADAEQAIELTRHALSVLDFPRLRSMDSALAGGTDARVVLAKQQDRLVLRIDGRAIPVETVTKENL